MNFFSTSINNTGVFISYHYDADSSVAKIITQIVSNDKTNHYTVVKEKWKGRDEKIIKEWIDRMLRQTRLTVLLISRQTFERKYVSYELKISMSQGNLLLPILIDSEENGFSEEEAAEILYRLREDTHNEKLEMKKWCQGEGEKNILRWLNDMF